MGAHDFAVYQDDTDATRAFRDAVADAQHEYGHRGYTGTIAEKHSYEIVTDTPMTEDDARAHAAKLLADPAHPLHDKWGPAGAIPVLTGCRRVRLTVPDVPGGFPSLKDAAEEALTRSGTRREGETIAYGLQGAYSANPRTGRIISGDLDVPLQGGPLEHTGWLFFGYASS